MEHKPFLSYEGCKLIVVADNNDLSSAVVCIGIVGLCMLLIEAQLAQYLAERPNSALDFKQHRCGDSVGSFFDNVVGGRRPSGPNPCIHIQIFKSILHIACHRPASGNSVNRFNLSCLNTSFYPVVKNPVAMVHRRSDPPLAIVRAPAQDIFVNHAIVCLVVRFVGRLFASFFRYHFGVILPVVELLNVFNKTRVKRGKAVSYKTFRPFFEAFLGPVKHGLVD